MTEMTKLITMLTDAEIPFQVINHPFFHTPQVWYPCRSDAICDVICSEFSYGGSNGLLEIMGLLTEKEAEYDDVVGWLTAENVFQRIKTHYERTNALL